MEDTIWLEWIAEVMATKPVGNELLESQRGQEVVDLLLDLESNDFNWHRGDADTFWIDAQMCIKYQLSNAEIKFLAKQQPGVVNYKKHAKERNAYSEMMRGLEKLKELNFPEIYNHSLSPEEEKEMAIEQKYISPYQKLDELEKRFFENQFLFGQKVMEAAMKIVSSEKKITVDNFFNIGSHRIKFTVEEVTN
ncbi:hypothetical protein A2G57_03465 [Streptococcus pneumoniae]|nr:hypothetical protein A2G57_03465 [Streptococcus pneumoniae]